MYATAGPASPGEEAQAAEVVQEARLCLLVAALLREAARLVGVEEREAHLAAPLGDHRALHRRERLQPQVLQRLRELERVLGVRLRRIPVALRRVAARTPLERTRPDPVAARAAGLRQPQRLAEQRDRVPDPRRLQPDGAEPEQRLRAVGVVEELTLGQRPRALAQRVGGVDLTEVHARPRLAMQEAKREVGRRRRRHADAREHVDAVLPPALADQPLRANECCASLLPEHGDIGTPDRRQMYDGRSAFHVFCIERSATLRDPSTD